MVALDLGAPESVPSLCSLSRMSSPYITFPKTVCLPLSQGQGTNVMKNCEPLVLGPALAIDSSPGTSCFSLKFQSGKVRPYMDLPPVPLWLVKSPPWAMKLGMMRWKWEFLYPKPFSWVQRARKLAAVLGVSLSKRLKTSLPTCWLPKSILKKTFLSAIPKIQLCRKMNENNKKQNFPKGMQKGRNKTASAILLGGEVANIFYLF